MTTATKKATSSKATKWWAVGLKGWVEIRSSSTPLRLHTSQTILKVKVKEFDWWNESSFKIKPLKISTKVWLGGTIVGRTRSGTFRNRTGMHIGSGKCQKISKALMSRALKLEG